MKRQEKYDEISCVVLSGMCEKVGADFKTFDFKAIDWRSKFKWTAKEAVDFADTVTEKIYGDKMLTGYSKRTIRNMVDLFVIGIGWEITEEENTKEVSNG